MAGNWKEFIGTFAAVCTTVAFVPQIIKVRKSGGRDLSYPMLFFYLVGLLLWFVYGLMIHSPSVIWANVITALLVVLCILVKWNFERKDVAEERGASEVKSGEVSASHSPF